MTIPLLDLFGTTEAPPSRRTLRAGPLSAVLEAGQLRNVRWHDVEVLRGVAYLLRDAAWGTLPTTLSDLEVREDEGGFQVTYVTRAEGPAGRLVVRARIDGSPEGRLSFEATATAETDFTTNRTGFVVLHPDDVAGQPLRVEHCDGSVESRAFPGPISPHQPAFDIVALAHEPAPGVTAQVAFEGGTWEMEDQRNWSDASFKTYVRPLALPFPYVIPATATERQAVLLTLSGEPTAATGEGPGPHPVEGRMPPVHLRLDPREEIPESLPLPGLARGLIVRWRPGEGPERIAAAARLAAREAMALGVEAVFSQMDPDGEAAECLRALAGQPVATLLVAAARDLRTRPTGLPEGEAPLGATVAALRRGGFPGRIGTGVPSFFTEFNRNPPPLADFAFFGTCPIVHAADDLSVMETLRALPAIRDSAARLLPGTPLWPGPLVIPPVLNPYGPGLADTDGLHRICLAGSDPRHGALFGAAHLVAALAAVLPGAGAVAPLHANGPAGLSSAEGTLHPLAFVVRQVAEAEGAMLAEGPALPGLASLAWERDGSRTLLVANTSEEVMELPWPEGTEQAARLAPGARGWEDISVTGMALVVEPYATYRLVAKAA